MDRKFSDLSATDIIKTTDLSPVYRRALAEPFVGQSMVAASGSESGKMYYWARQNKSSFAQIDYLFAHSGKILPIKLKSGLKGKLKSLHLFL